MLDILVLMHYLASDKGVQVGKHYLMMQKYSYIFFREYVNSKESGIKTINNAFYKILIYILLQHFHIILNTTNYKVNISVKNWVLLMAKFTLRMEYLEYQSLLCHIIISHLQWTTQNIKKKNVKLIKFDSKLYI